MRIHFFLLISSFGLLMPSFLLAQQPSNPPSDTYYKYEREEVGFYRDKINFVLPEPQAVEVEVQETEALPDAISLDHLFPTGKKLHIEADPNLLQLIKLDIEAKGKIRSVNGFRVQVYAGSSRNQASQRKQTLLGMFPDHVSYLGFEAPNFVVKIGDFMDKEEALLFCRELRQTYAGAFVRPDLVNVLRQTMEKPEEEEESQDEWSIDPNNRN
ncbi:MAG: SPOR domain-containing protein [Bacteroidota bacterium]